MGDAARPDIPVPTPTPDAPPPSNGDALSNLFTQAGIADVPQKDFGLLAQCDVPGDDRRKNIQQKLKDTDDPSTKLGRDLIGRLLKGEQIDDAFLLELAAHGGQALSEFIKQQSALGPVATDTLAAALANQIRTLSSGEKNIFSNVPLAKKTNEEGKRLVEGEKTLVLAKASLLELGAHEALTPDTLSSAVTHISESEVSAMEYPNWFVQGLDTAIRDYNISEMTLSDLPVLKILSENLWHLTNTTSLAAEEAKMAQTPDDLTGLTYVYRRCLDASGRIKTLEAEKQKAENEAEHQKALTEYRSRTFSEQAQSVQEQVKEFIKSNRSLSLEKHDLLRKVLSFDTQRRKQYFEGQRSIDSMLTALSSFTDEAFLTRVSADFSNERSSNYQYNDGTHLGTLSAMTPEAAQAVVRENIERELYACAFGFIRGGFENSPPWGQDHLDQQRLNWTTQALTAVARGNAVKLLSAQTPEQQSVFSRPQIQFRSAILNYLTELQGRDNVKATAFKNALRIGATNSDTEVVRIQERMETQRREALEKRAATETAMDELLARERAISPKLAEKNAAKSLLLLLPEDTPTYITVVGTSDQRHLGINTEEIARLVQEQQNLEVKLAQSSLDPEERISIADRFSKTKTTLRFFTALEAQLARLEQARFIAREGIMKKPIACYDISALHVMNEKTSPTIDTYEYYNLETNSGNTSAVPSRIRALQKRFEALRQTDPVDSTIKAETIAREIADIENDIAIPFGKIDAYVTSALTFAANDMFSQYGDLSQLSVKKGHPFNGILRSRKA